MIFKKREHERRASRSQDNEHARADIYVFNEDAEGILLYARIDEDAAVTPPQAKEADQRDWQTK
jgi:hypothetical protein